MTLRRTVVSKLGAALVGLSVVASYTVVASAQVGHDPAHSPYRDIALRPGPVLVFGKLTGDRGDVGAGISNATTFGARFELPLGRTLVMSLGTSYLHGDRFIIDPRTDSTSPARRTGPFTSDLVHAEFGLQLRLTGGKSWRGLAPHVGAGLGLALDVNSPGDTTKSGYRFGTKVTLGAGTGVRWFPRQRITVNADLRALMWRLRYPLSFHTPSPSDGSLVIPLNKPLNEWTLHPWFSVGVGWTF